MSELANKTLGTRTTVKNHEVRVTRSELLPLVGAPDIAKVAVSSRNIGSAMRTEQDIFDADFVVVRWSE